MSDETPVSLPAWTRLLAPLSMKAVAAMPWRCPELACTPGSRERLRRWVAAGCPDADPRTVTYIGDRDLRPVVLDVLRACPPPMRHHVVTGCAILSVGGQTRGWFASMTPPAPAGEQAHVVVLDHGTDQGDLPGVLAHELAHSWLASIRPPVERRPTGDEIDDAAERYVSLTAFAIECKMLDRLTRRAEIAEHQACNLARCLGFQGMGASGWDRAMAVREYRASVAGPVRPSGAMTPRK